VDDFLQLFAFRTGVPCGYLLFFLAGAIGVVAAIIALLVGLLRKPKRPILAVASSAFLVLGALWLVGNIAYGNALEMNPDVSGNSFVGTWKWNDSTLTLRADGSYVLIASGYEANRLETQLSRGNWQFTPVVTIHLHDSRGQRIPDLRGLSFLSKLHLVVEFDDPDSWDGDLAFHREPAT